MTELDRICERFIEEAERLASCSDSELLIRGVQMIVQLHSGIFGDRQQSLAASRLESCARHLHDAAFQRVWMEWHVVEVMGGAASLVVSKADWIVGDQQ